MTTHTRTATTKLLCAACGDPSPIADAACVACGADVLLDGRYRLDAVLGRGGMGVTYRATRLMDGATVAIKELGYHRVDSLKTVELFEREARVLRTLSHRSIPAWYDDFTVGAGKRMTLCIVQEFIAGQTLEAEIATRRPDERAVLLVMRDLLKTLIHLSKLRPPVVHRDIKPQNLMRRADGSLVLIDFGSVRDAIKDSLAGGSTVAGTFGYMAPEQFAGDATPATDIYGLGATALALLAGTGAERFLGRDGRLGSHDRVPMSAGLRALVNKMLETDPGQRPSARQVLADVNVLLADPAPVAVSAGSQTQTDPKPRGLSSAESMILGLLFLAGIGWLIYSASTPGDDRWGHDDMPAQPVSAPRTVEEVAPPFGLEFGMTHTEALAAWPKLGEGTVAAPTAMAVELQTLGPKPGVEARGERPVAPPSGESPVAAGTVYTVETTYVDRPTTCQLRFAEPVVGAAREGLVSFVCVVHVVDATMLGVVSDEVFQASRRLFGPPTGGRRVRPELNESVEARWDSKVAYVEQTRQLKAAALAGQLLQWQTTLETQMHHNTPNK